MGGPLLGKIGPLLDTNSVWDSGSYSASSFDVLTIKRSVSASDPCSPTQSTCTVRSPAWESSGRAQTSLPGHTTPQSERLCFSSEPRGAGRYLQFSPTALTPSLPPVLSPPTCTLGREGGNAPPAPTRSVSACSSEHLEPVGTAMAAGGSARQWGQAAPCHGGAGLLPRGSRYFGRAGMGLCPPG